MAIHYILKATLPNKPPVYFMNFIMSTEDKDCAYPFKSRKDAELEQDRFKYLFYKDEEPKITVERIGD